MNDFKRYVPLIICMATFVPSTSPSKLQLCGKQLIDTLSLLCKDYNTPPPATKRDDRFSNVYQDEMVWYPNGYFNGNLRLNGLKYYGAIKSFGNQLDADQSGGHLGERRLASNVYLKRKKRGVSDECCAKPCSMKTLKSYCSSYKE